MCVWRLADQSVYELGNSADDEDDDDDDKNDRRVLVAAGRRRARRRRDRLYWRTWWWSTTQRPSGPQRLPPTWLPVSIQHHHHHHHRFTAKIQVSTVRPLVYYRIKLHFETDFDETWTGRWWQARTDSVYILPFGPLKFNSEKWRAGRPQVAIQQSMFWCIFTAGSGSFLTHPRLFFPFHLFVWAMSAPEALGLYKCSHYHHHYYYPHTSTLPSLSLEVGSINPAKGSGRALKLPRWDPGRCPGRKRILCAFTAQNYCVKTYRLTFSIGLYILATIARFGSGKLGQNAKTTKQIAEL